MILALPLNPDVKKINPNGVAALAKDVAYLSEFIDGLENAMILKENLDELQQVRISLREHYCRIMLLLRHPSEADVMDTAG